MTFYVGPPGSGDRPPPDELERRRSAGRALPARRAGQPADLPPPPAPAADTPLDHPIPDRHPFVDFAVALALVGLFLVFAALLVLGLLVGPG